MRVFCTEHKRGFLTPRQSPIKCENKGHLLGELDFEGKAKLPLELQWQYCCNCEHFCPIDFDQVSLERCPVCTRRSSLLYLCDRCYTISFESNTPLQTKNFTLTSEGAPQPLCPGCLQETSIDLREHSCDVLGSSFITALNSCPICQERLDIGPSFPSSVAHYLKRTKAANKVNVTFDYETELFVPVGDGEFVLVNTGNEAIQTIVLPRTPRLTSRRDFYEFYQDYYHCAKPDAGEVHIIQPAAVVPTVEGWKLLVTGILEVHQDQQMGKAPADAVRKDVLRLAREAPRISTPAMKEETPVTPCNDCGALVETRYAFCWKCGNPLTPQHKTSIAQPAKPGTTMSSAEFENEEDELTVQHDVRPSVLSWAAAKEPEPAGSANGSVLKLIAVAVAGLILVSLGLFVLTRSASRMDSATAAQPNTASASTNPQSDPKPSPGRAEDGDAAIESAPKRTSPARPDDELKVLRKRRIAATVSDRPAVLQAFSEAEKQYPNDYRFPYERAKLATKGSHSNDEAFGALSLAAEKAINTGKAHEMLHGLAADKSRDFRELSHGHNEWKQLAEALRNKDTRLLTAKVRF